MIKVITYGTYDLLHHGHIKLLERARALGDYLIVGVTADDFDKTRGKINVQQSLMERLEAVRQTGLADEIIIEEYEGQKIDDIKRLGVDIFTVGSDWEGKFDYLNEYCRVIYLPRTQGVSSSDLRARERSLRLGLVGEGCDFLSRYVNESRLVNGVTVAGLCTGTRGALPEALESIAFRTDDYEALLDRVDAVYLYSAPALHYDQIRMALERGVHVLVESPVCERVDQYEAVCAMARGRGLILNDACRTAYSTAFYRLSLLLKSGRIGEIVSVDTTCTSLADLRPEEGHVWNTMGEWGPTAMLPVFWLLGSDYRSKHIVSRFSDEAGCLDSFSKVDFTFDHATASIKVGKGVKSEGEMVVSGTRGYAYVPAPWWKMDYFEVRYEDPSKNQRYFYQLDGEGIRYELVDFVKCIERKTRSIYISEDISRAIIGVYQDFLCGIDCSRI